MGFEARMEGGQPRCVYKDAPTNFVNLSPIEAVSYGPTRIPNLTVESLKDIDSSLYLKYKEEQTRVVKETMTITEKIGKEKLLKDAFQRLQDAENVRDKVPDAYQQARAAYYILKEGDTWKEREKERIMQAEVNPLVQKLVDTKANAVRQYESQRKTVDVVNGLKDNVLSLKDEMKYAADTFQGQINKVQNAIQRERRTRGGKESSGSMWDWLDTALNFVIICALLYVIYLMYKKFMLRSAQQPAVILQA